MTGGRRRRSARPRPGGAREGALLWALLFALLLLAPVIARAQALDSLSLHWTAPVDPPDGAVASYAVRYSTAPITAANFALCDSVSAPAPAAPGTRQGVVVRGLVHGRPYWFAIRSCDAAGNWSDLSNVVRWDGLDASPPAAPGSPAASVIDGNKAVQVAWLANTEPDLRGYFVYRATAIDGPWTKLDDQPLVATSYVDRALPANAGRLWYALSAVDMSGTESARSAVVPVIFSSPLASGRSAWRLLAPSPNPARGDAAMHLGVEVPLGAEAARLEIVDAANQVVRRFDVHAGVGGIALVQWDGTNDRGVHCAPGVYRACLVAGDTREFVRLARAP